MNVDSEKSYVETFCLSGILIVLIIFLSYRYNNNAVNKGFYYLLMFILILSLVWLMIKVLKGEDQNQENLVNENTNVINARLVSNNKQENRNIQKPLKEDQILNNYRNDFFTFRDTLYQLSSNDFDYADIMNQEHHKMDDEQKCYKGRIWDLYDNLTKPNYSKIPVKYDKNLDNASKYYPVYYLGQTVRYV